jgi:hypothetical protein
MFAIDCSLLDQYLSDVFGVTTRHGIAMNAVLMTVARSFCDGKLATG